MKNKVKFIFRSQFSLSFFIWIRLILYALLIHISAKILLLVKTFDYGHQIVTVLAKIDEVLKFDFIALNESRRIQLQFSINRIKIGQIEPEIQPAKGAQGLYAGPMTWRDVIGLLPVVKSLVTLYICFLIVEDYTKDTQEISGTQLPYRRCESSIFVIYSSTSDARRLCYYLLSCKEAFFHLCTTKRAYFRLCPEKRRKKNSVLKGLNKT